MTRQVDVKALVSHIVRGDGLDKCRICMGDTSQGQVHLTDTVMMDGDKAVTLSELLEMITGVKVATDEALPPAICVTCARAVAQAAEFRTLVESADNHWTDTLNLLELTPQNISKSCTKMIINIRERNIYLTEEPIQKTDELKAKSYIRSALKESGYCCYKCKMTFMYPQQLFSHLNQSADLIRACYICGLIMSRNELLLHLVDEHGRKAWECKKCPALFLKFKEYKQHAVKAHVPGACTCGDCGRSFPSLAAYHAHQSVHSQRTCPNCDLQFNNQSCYFYHIKKCCHIEPKKDMKSKITVTLKNKENKTLKVGARGSRNNECICDYCKKKFSGKKFVAAHIQIVHTRDTHRPCAYCGKLFAAAHMSTHMKSHGAHSFECQQCGVKMKSKLGFEQHLRLHTGEKPYPCQYCDERFSASSRRSAHVRNMHRKIEVVLKQVCKMCSARFRQPHQLRHHMKTVHGERAGSVFECKECKEKFASCRSLVNHNRKQHNRNCY